jgi:energy-coupling factor transporter ATP-binding protein EcfA2
VVTTVESRGVRIEVEALGFSYDEGRRAVPAVREISFVAEAGGSLALLGPTGSGKSTLLQLLRGLLPPDAGAVVLDGLSPADRGYESVQRSLGIVFQQPELQLFAATARDDVAFGPRQLGWNDAAVDEAVAAALDLVGLPLGGFGHRHPMSLSGGEQRRLALAGVLAMNPRTLLLDEPFVSLDPAGRRELAGVLERLSASGLGLVLATHDVDLAWALCDDRLVVDGGRLVASGPWDFSGAGGETLTSHRLEEPFLVRLWRRIGWPVEAAPRTAAEAGRLL